MKTTPSKGHLDLIEKSYMLHEHPHNCTHSSESLYLGILGHPHENYTQSSKTLYLGILEHRHENYTHSTERDPLPGLT